MGPDGAVNILFRREMDDAAGPGARSGRRRRGSTASKFANPYVAAERGLHRRGDRAAGHAAAAHPGARDPRTPSATRTRRRSTGTFRYDAARHRSRQPAVASRRRGGPGRSARSSPRSPKSPERPALFAGSSGAPTERVATPADVADLDYLARSRVPGRVPVHARRPADDVPRAALDDAAVRGVRLGGGDQPALPLPPRPGPDRAQRGVRPADPDGLRRRPRDGAERGRARSAWRSRASTTCRSCSTAIPLDRVSTSMTINATASILLCLYIAVAERQGVAVRQALRARCRTTS